ncbi:MAG: transcription-repair coupling factor [Firmicutes bacterium]|nr:transcription-repair coupling factor [Bacillota bacterium]
MTRKGMINITGASEGRIAPIISHILEDKKGQSLIVVPTITRARRLAVDLSFFDARPIYVMPAEDESFLQYEARSKDDLLERLSILDKVSAGEECILIAPALSAIRHLPPAEIFEEDSLILKVGEDVDLDSLKQKLFRMGYERVSMIEGRGEYSIRGGILDIFMADGDNPYRIEFFDTEVDSIRTFDMESQRSEEQTSRVKISRCCQIPRDAQLFASAAAKIAKAYNRRIDALRKREGNSESVYELTKRRDQLVEYADSMTNLQYLEKLMGYFYGETQYLWDYMKEPEVFIDDPARILENIDAYERELADDIEALLSEGRAIGEDFSSAQSQEDYFRLYDFKGYIFTPFVSTIKNAPFLDRLVEVDSRPTPSFNGRMDVFRDELSSYVSSGYKVTLVCSSDEREDNLRDFLRMEGLEEKIDYARGTLTGGMDFPGEKKCFIWEGDILGQSYRKKRRKKKTKGQQIKSFSDVQEGDYVVHEAHGIGRFTGIEQLTVQGVSRDYLKVKYAGEDSLYIPVDQLGMLQKYVGGEGITPRLNKLTGSEWKKTKAKAKAAIEEMAEDLIQLSAERMHADGYAFSEDTVWQKEFEDSFPYEETDDQLRSAEEIKRDMERPVPMDRLLCGDVGFGKTEVAARALFKCVSDGKQAAVLVPTTLLANQHYYTLKDRFERFPFRVEMLSRFRTPKQQKQILADVKAGRVDLIIGTHRLLSQDVEFKDLGLLVVDEEQRFGVRHKERIKQLRANVDVLTLSATPIPRTLHMSLSGMKDMSTLEEPPVDRVPVRTYVMEQENHVIREAIEKELSRGGQVYVLYNRVETISYIANLIQRLVPEASIEIGHGQMKEKELENIIMDFAAGEFNVLVSTTIIESGIDIPNVNTMIILDADRFGLAQLYQLRGRVGRTGRMAYAYLMYQKDKNLSEIAEKRLRAIRDFTEFGSGFRIAMKDLELRGAGNILGTAQSGHMVNVGYELYCKMLEDAVVLAKGGQVLPEAEETVFSIPLPAIISRSYIDDDVLRLQMYKKIAMVETKADEQDLIDELIDRFGDIPDETMNLVKISRIRTVAGRVGIREISREGYKVMFRLWDNIKFPQAMMASLIANYGQRIMINAGEDPYIRLTIGHEEALEAIERFLDTASGEQKVN